MAELDGLGQCTTLTYDLGQLWAMENQVNTVTTTLRDGMNRVISTINPLGQQWYTRNDANSRPVVVIDPQNARVTNIYDTSGAVVASQQ